MIRNLENGSDALLSFDPPIIYTAPSFDSLSKPIQYFILLHEEGHYVNDSYNEFDADRHALYRLSNIAPELIPDVIKSLTEFLDLNQTEHAQRIEALMNLKNEFMYSNINPTDRIYTTAFGLNSGVVVGDINIVPADPLPDKPITDIDFEDRLSVSEKIILDLDVNEEIKHEIDSALENIIGFGEIIPGQENPNAIIVDDPRFRFRS